MISNGITLLQSRTLAALYPISPVLMKTPLQGSDLSRAATRTITREEDIAYNLLGIFDVNVPLLYGEGSKALTEFQENIIKALCIFHSSLEYLAISHNSSVVCLLFHMQSSLTVQT